MAKEKTSTGGKATRRRYTKEFREEPVQMTLGRGRGARSPSNTTTGNGPLRQSAHMGPLLPGANRLRRR